MIEELAKLIPQEREIMLTAGHQLSLEERQSIAKHMLDRGTDREIVKQCTKLSDKKLSQISSNKAESTPPLHILEVVPNTDQLVQAKVSKWQRPVVALYENTILC